MGDRPLYLLQHISVKLLGREVASLFSVLNQFRDGGPSFLLLGLNPRPLDLEPLNPAFPLRLAWGNLHFLLIPLELSGYICIDEQIHFTERHRLLISSLLKLIVVSQFCRQDHTLPRSTIDRG